MVFMAIDYQHLIYASRMIFYICIEMFNPFQAYLIIGPSINSWFNNPII